MVLVDARPDLDSDLIWLTVTGELTVERKHHLRTAIGKALVACPRSVVVDLSGLTDLTGDAAPLLQAAQERARREFGVFLLWVVPAGGHLRERLRNPFWQRMLHLYPDAAAARDAADRGTPPPERFRVTLPPDPMTLSAARLLAYDACLAWSVPSLAPAAARVAFELGLNAVRHAGTPYVLTVSRRGVYLTIGVRDGDTHHPGPPRAGLRVVARLSAAWGCLRAPDGKLIWAALHLPERKPAPAEAGPAEA